jgi:sulfofructose kinase
MPAAEFDVVAVGHATFELLTWVDRYPGAGDAIWASKRLWTGGGMAGNLVHAVARLGGRPALACAIGDDAIGEQIVSQLCNVGANTDYVMRRPNTASQITVMIVTPDLRRAGLVTDLPAEAKLRAEEVPDAWLQAGRVFFTDMDPPDTAIALARRARALGVPVAYDLQMAQDHVNLPGHDRHIAEMVALADYCFADEENFLLWRGLSDLTEAAESLLAERPEMTLLVTRGAAGALVITRREALTVPAFQVEMVDSIGAGDALHGAFLYAHLGLGWSLQRAARFGSAAAALSCTRAGARNGLPVREEVLAMLDGTR